MADIKQKIKKEREAYAESLKDPSSVNVNDLEQSIMTLMAKHRIRMDDSFRDFDSLRSGFTTIDQFKAALNIVKLPRAKFTAAELESLVQKYVVLQEDGKYLVHYKKMLDFFNTVFTEQNLEKQPTMEVLGAKKVPLYTTKKDLNEKEQKFEAIISQIATTVRTRRIQIKPLFQDFDQSLCGLYATRRVTKSTFERALSMLGLKIQPDDYQILCDKYNDLNNGTVNYLMFLKDIDAMQDMDKKHEPPQTRFYAEKKPNEITVDTVMKKVQYKVLAERIRMVDIMKDFDPLRSGSISQNQFKSCFTVAKIRLVKEEMEILCNRFRNTNKPDLVMWREFCDEVDKVFTENKLEKNPMKELMNSQDFAKSFKQSFKAYNDPNNFSITVEELLEKIRFIVLSRRIMIRPMFQDFDPYNHGKINQVNFFQCLDKITQLSTQEHKLLADKYMDKSNGEITYVQFIADIDPKDLDLPDFGKSTKQPKISGLGKGVKELEPTLDNITLQLAKKAIRLKDFFFDYDPMRKGYISESKFVTAISTSNLELTAQEMKALVNYYAYEDDTTTNQVHYYTLCKDLKCKLVQKK